MNYQVLTQYPGPVLEAAWQEFLADAAFPTHYTTPNFFTDPYSVGAGTFAVLAMDGGKVEAVVTGSDTGSAIRCGMAVRPQAAFRRGADRLEAMRALLDGINEKNSAAELVNIYTWEPVDGAADLGFSVERCEGESAVVMLDVTKPADELFEDFSDRRRVRLRRSERKGKLLVKELETEDELRELYEIHMNWNARKGNTPDPFETFRAAMGETSNRQVFIALLEGRVIAGSYYRFCPGGMVEYAANNSMPEYQKLDPNELIGWHAIRWACDADFTHFSMGASHPFLRRFGGELVSACRFRIDRTFLRRHEMKETLKRFALKTYLSLPDTARQKIKQGLGRA